MSGGNTTTTETLLVDSDNFVAEEDLYNTDDWPAYLTWIQKVFATLSIICSYVVCRELVSDIRSRQGRKSTNARNSANRNVSLQRSIGKILLNLSVSDIIFSFAVFLGEWPAPRDTLYIHHASGNQQLCTFQGWLRALGYMASPMFSVALNTFYLLLIRYRKQDSELSKLERKVTVSVWIYAFVLSIVPIPLQAYNSDWDVCWIVPSPLDCVEDECTRGVIANKLEIFYSFVHIWTCMFVSVWLMILLFHTVKKLEDKSNSYIASVKSGLVTRVAVQSTESTRHDNKGSDDSKKDKSNTKQIQEEPHVPCDIKEPVQCHAPTAKFHNEKQIPMNNDEPSLDNHKHNNVQKNRMSPLISRVSSSWERISQRISDAWFPDSQSSAHSKSRAVAYQGILFTLAFMSTHLFDMIASIMWRTTKTWNLYFDIAAYMVMQPALGILNFLIFSRNRKSMSTIEGRWLRSIVFSYLCCSDRCKCTPKDDRDMIV